MVLISAANAQALNSRLSQGSKGETPCLNEQSQNRRMRSQLNRSSQALAREDAEGHHSRLQLHAHPSEERERASMSSSIRHFVRASLGHVTGVHAWVSLAAWLHGRTAGSLTAPDRGNLTLNRLGWPDLGADPGGKELQGHAPGMLGRAPG